MRKKLALPLLLLACAPAAVLTVTCSPGQYMQPSDTTTGHLDGTHNMPTVSWSSVSSNATCQNPASNAPAGNAWCPSAPGTGDWLQFDMGTPQYLAGWGTYGQSGTSNWVTKYDLKTSLDGVTWALVGSLGGNADSTSLVSYTPQFIARFLRFYVTGANGWAGLRALINIYRNVGCVPCPVGTYSPVGTAVRCVPCPAGTYSNTVGASACIAAPSGFVAVSDGTGLQFVSASLFFTASSWTSGNIASPPQLKASINTPGAGGWVAGTKTIGSEYLILDVGYVTNIWAIITQGRDTVAQWITSYDAYWSTDLVTWVYVGNFAANADSSSEVSQAVAFTAQYVKLVPTGYNGWISTRAGLQIGPPLLSLASTVAYAGTGWLSTCATSQGAVAIAECKNATVSVEGDCCQSVFSDT